MKGVFAETDVEFNSLQSVQFRFSRTIAATGKIFSESWLGFGGQKVQDRESFESAVLHESFSRTDFRESNSTSSVRFRFPRRSAATGKIFSES